MICNQETLKEIQEMTEVRWMLITPELAREMLKKNTNNIRNIANGNIQAIVNDINNDGWRINGETICFNSKGVLSKPESQSFASLYPMFRKTIYTMSGRGELFMKSCVQMGTKKQMWQSPGRRM